MDGHTTSRRNAIKLAAGAVAVPAIISITATPAYATAGSGGPIVIDDYQVAQTANGTVTGSMAFGERLVSAATANSFSIGGGTTSTTVPSFPPGVAVQYPTIAGATTVDLSACTTIQVAASAGYTTSIVLGDTLMGFQAVVANESGGVITWTLASFSVNLSLINQIQMVHRSTGTLTGPLTAQ